MEKALIYAQNKIQAFLYIIHLDFQRYFMGNYSKWQVILYTRLGKVEGSNFPTVLCHQSS